MPEKSDAPTSHKFFYYQFEDPISFAQGYVAAVNLVPDLYNIREMDLNQWFTDASALIDIETVGQRT